MRQAGYGRRLEDDSEVISQGALNLPCQLRFDHVCEIPAQIHGAFPEVDYPLIQPARFWISTVKLALLQRCKRILGVDERGCVSRDARDGDKAEREHPADPEESVEFERHENDCETSF